MNTYKTQEGGLKVGKIVTHVVIGFFALIFLIGSIGNVSSNQIGVKTRFGKVTGVLQAGLFFKVPFIEQVNKIGINTRTINYDKNGQEGDSHDSSQLAGASKDLQDVSIGVVVQYKIDPTKADQVFIQYKTVENYESNVIESIVRKTVKTISAQYTAEELVTKRAEYNDKVTSALTTAFQESLAILQTANITNFEFSKSFTQAIEAKVTAVQNAEAAKNKLEQVKFEAAQTIATAQAQAEAIKIQAQAINSQGGADYVQLQFAKVWDGHLPTTMVPGSAVPFLNIK